tara:strand:+ start:5401 stop:7827 length:2427 start_codon:yes stop_codon:yes gene_type:complete
MELSDLRHLLAVPYVMEQYGHHAVEQTSSRIKYHNPFRVDNNPSFDVWYDSERGWRWGDFAEGTQGSSIDLVQRFESLTDKEAIDKAYELVVKQKVDRYENPTLVEAKKEFDYESAHDYLARGRSNAVNAVNAMLWRMIDSHPAIAHLNPEYLVKEWQLSSDGNDVLVPYMDEKDLVGYKIRKPDGTKLNAKGANMVLYGLWKLGDSHEDQPVMLCEGETDCWAAQAHLTSFHALGVAGAGHQPEKLGAEALAGRTIYMAFDGDEAGRNALSKWHRYLSAHNCKIYNIPMPDGADIASMSPKEVASLPDRALVQMPKPEGLVRRLNQYVKVRGENDTPVSNWSLLLNKRLVGDEGQEAFEGVLLPTNKVVVLPSDALSSRASLVRWCISNQVAWTGSAQDHDKLLQLLQHDSFLVPEGRMTSRVGYHSGDIVWHDGHLGTDSWTYVPPLNDIDVKGKISVVNNPVNTPAVLHGLMEMYSSDVMTPFLAWLALAPIRPLFKQFPSLVVSGASGTGKTTLVEKVLEVFSGSSINATLTNTTAHAVASFFGASNAFPIWFDEYRFGARQDAKQQLDQMLRDAYTGQRSQKGGAYENKQRLISYASDVPVVVSGEDSVIETSLTDRSILLRLTKRKKGSLDTISSVDTAGFAHSYLSWIASNDHDPKVQLHSDTSLNDRQRYNLGFIDLGWRYLRDFVESAYPALQIPDIDVSMVREKAATAASENPILDAVLWAMESGLGCVWKDDNDMICISADSLLVEIRKAGTFTLPVTNTRGLKDYLIDVYGAEEKRKRFAGRQIRVLEIPYARIEE